MKNDEWLNFLKIDDSNGDFLAVWFLKESAALLSVPLKSFNPNCAALCLHWDKSLSCICIIFWRASPKHLVTFYKIKINLNLFSWQMIFTFLIWSIPTVFPATNKTEEVSLGFAFVCSMAFSDLINSALSLAHFFCDFFNIGNFL